MQPDVIDAAHPFMLRYPQTHLRQNDFRHPQEHVPTKTEHIQNEYIPLGTTHRIIQPLKMFYVEISSNSPSTKRLLPSTSPLSHKEILCHHVQQLTHKNGTHLGEG